ncbi:MAG: Required for respiratory growth protein 9 mitochondrial [Claussenomyces sp. TS43310]|nr:MAG: Required for respiratory growth protein 9 mitochondrial [Claussenomyces sp. TS43310]
MNSQSGSSITPDRRLARVPARSGFRGANEKRVCLAAQDKSTSSRKDSHSKNDADSPIVEFTPRAIDALAAEFRRDPASAESIQHSTRNFSLRHDSGLTTMTRSSRQAHKPSLAPTERLSRLSNQQHPSSSERSVEDTLESRSREPWQTQKAALKEKFPEGWNPRKRLSPDALAGIRAIHAQFPKQYTLSVLADRFEVSAEVMRRILKSKWEPNVEEEMDRQRRWFQRGESVWLRYAQLGMKPPVRWRKAVGKRKTYAGDQAFTTHTTERKVLLYKGSSDGHSSGALASRIL